MFSIETTSGLIELKDLIVRSQEEPLVIIQTMKFPTDLKNKHRPSEKFNNDELTLRLSLSVRPTRVQRATRRSPARGAIGSKMIPSLSRISKRGFVRASIDDTEMTQRDHNLRLRFRDSSTYEERGTIAELSMSPCVSVCFSLLLST